MYTCMAFSLTTASLAGRPFCASYSSHTDRVLLTFLRKGSWLAQGISSFDGTLPWMLLLITFSPLPTPFLKKKCVTPSWSQRATIFIPLPKLHPTPPLSLTDTSLPFSFYHFLFLESLYLHGCGSYSSLLKYPKFYLGCVPKRSSFSSTIGLFKLKYQEQVSMGLKRHSLGLFWGTSNLPESGRCYITFNTLCFCHWEVGGHMNIWGLFLAFWHNPQPSNNVHSGVRGNFKNLLQAQVSVNYRPFLSLSYILPLNS